MLTVSSTILQVNHLQQLSGNKKLAKWLIFLCLTQRLISEASSELMSTPLHVKVNFAIEVGQG